MPRATRLPYEIIDLSRYTPRALATMPADGRVGVVLDVVPDGLPALETLFAAGITAITRAGACYTPHGAWEDARGALLPPR